MKSILEELFYGNICPNTDCRSTDKETKELTGYLSDHHSAFRLGARIAIEVLYPKAGE